MNECQVISPQFSDGPSSSELAILRLLLQAYDCARGLNRDIWQFAVELEALMKLGINSCELRRLIAVGLVAHGIERIVRRPNGRKFRHVDSLAFVDGSCFVLT